MRVILTFVFVLICVTGKCYGFKKVSPQKSRIISGHPAEIAQIPWQVLIKRYKADRVYCGGSIISKDWVLTAGHCVDGLKSVYMIFGTLKMNEEPVAMTSDQLFKHDHYNPSNLNNDVALIKLPKSLEFSKTIAPIALLKKSDAKNDFIGKKVLISGWGYYSDEDLEYSDDLLYAFMTVVNNQVCLDVFGEGNIIESTLCAQGTETGHESICGGDSGGPMVIINGNEQPIQIGINSFVADQVCSEGYPAGFARLGSFFEYIEKITGITFD